MSSKRQQQQQQRITTKKPAPLQAPIIEVDFLDDADQNLETLLSVATQRLEQEQQEALKKRKQVEPRNVEAAKKPKPSNQIDWMSEEDALALTRINAVGMLERNDVLKATDLDQQMPYLFSDVQQVKTQFQERAVRLELAEGMVYLPKRFETVSDEDMEVLLRLKEHLVFVYEGPKEVKSGNPTALVRFAPRS